MRHETEYPPLEHFLAVKSELAASGNWLHCLKRGCGDVWSTFKEHVYASKKYELVYNVVLIRWGVSSKNVRLSETSVKHPVVILS